MQRLRRVAFCCVVAWVSAGAFAAGSTGVVAGPRDLLAHAAGESLWVAQVEIRPVDAAGSGGPLAGPPPPGPAEQTQVLVRQSKPNQHWHLLAVIPGRVTAMATRESQLAVLMADGQWLTVWADGIATGQPLPAAGQIRTLADDGQRLWAVGLVNGGLAAAADDLASQAAVTRPADAPPLAATTGPAATRPAPAAPPATSHRQPARLVLFDQDQGRWATVAELPADVSIAAVDDLSVAVVGHAPVVAYQLADGSVRTQRWSSDHTWEDIGWVRPPRGGRVANFQVLSDSAGPALWLSDGSDAGQFQVQAKGMGQTPDEAAPRVLKWVGPPSLAGVPASAISGSYLRVIGPAAGDKVYEQRYELSGAPVGTPAEVTVPPELGDSPVMLWMQGLLLASLAFTVGTSVYRQVTPGGAALATAASSTSDAAAAATPAPMGVRAAAGAIDLLPLLMGVVAVGTTAARHAQEPLPAAAAWLLGTTVAIYLAHTTVLEAMTARSAGKWVMGLRVATPDGGRPAVWQLVTRNLLRVVDPLVWIVLSPLRQRTADVLVGTLVVREAGQSPPPPSHPPEPGA